MKVSQNGPTPGNIFGDAHGSLTQQMYTLAGTYRIVEGEVPVELVAGARYNALNVPPLLALTTSSLLCSNRKGTSR
jgi:hypothetical protein